MKLFQLHRKDDNGIFGVVSDGVIFPSGKVSMCWRGAVTSIVIYDDIQMVEEIHGHNGCTEICYILIDKNKFQ